jgi:transcriptional regulator with XRE-family HTH domain
MNIGPRIMALREERQLSLSELARESEISKGLLHKIENQEGANPGLDTLRKIARAFQITVGELIGNEIVVNVRQLPTERPEWLTKLTDNLRRAGREPDEDLLEALYVLQNRKGQERSSDDDWLYLYQTLERSFK